LRIAVIGAGIIGVTTAYELASDGHEVHVLERLQAVASDASFANAGVVAPGHVGPWSAPGMPWSVLTGLLSKHSAVRLGPGVLAAPGWVARWLWACRTRTYRANRRRMQRLAMYSRERLDALTLVHALEYDQRRGYLVLLRTARDLERVSRDLDLLAEVGVAHELIDEAGARALEPGIAPTAPLHAALSLRNDLVGNCRQFAHQLKAKAQERGARFRFGVAVTRLSTSHPGGLYWRAADGPDTTVHPERYDAIVLCTGRIPAGIADKLGVRLPVLSVHGYSMTAPVRHREGEPDPGPASGVMDEGHAISITRLGQRVRVAGISELGVAPQLLRDQALNTLYKVLDEWFPGAADLGKVQHWKGARPMLPDGPPVIGGAGPQGLWLNLGHGGCGWALACGSARVLADQIAGRKPEIDVEGLDMGRLR
jgi:D-amino-acid dehydrogenase